ncbi:DUF1682 containing protein [Pyrenophora tritici-repentis]|nr:DUF1682 containing protein [Pyrenophora tritici-repentis]
MRQESCAQAKKGKALDLQQRQEYHGGSVFWSPRKLREARAREAVRERDETEEKLQKARSKKQREEARLQRQDELEERRVERQRLKEMRELERAEKAAERARQKEERDAAKAIQLPQKGKRRASAATSSNNKRQKRVEAARAGAQVQEEPPAPPSKLTPEHLVFCKRATTHFKKWPLRPIVPPRTRQEGLAYLAQLIDQPQEFETFVKVTNSFYDE